MIPVSEADRILAATVLPLPTREVPLHAAVGRVLRQEVRTDRDQPPFDRVTMDGIALAWGAVAAGRRRFRRQAVQPAGLPPLTLEGPDACIEVTTGAVLPTGCDAVVRVEDLRDEDGAVALRDGVEVHRGQNVHARGSDAAAGMVAIAGAGRLASPHVGIAAALGHVVLRVASLPRVALVSTGDEVVAVDVAPRPHQIRDANAHALAAALAASGYGKPVALHLRDELETLTEGLDRALAETDVVITIGGVSMGEWDLVPEALDRLGATRRLHRVAQRPGKPFLFATRRDRAVFGLPGNPVSALVCLHRHVLPWLERASGVTPAVGGVRAARPLARHAALTRFLPVALNVDGDAEPVAPNTSGDLLALAPSHGFVELPPGPDPLPAGERSPYYAWRGA